MWNSPVTWAIIAVVVLIFGGQKIPEMMRGLGQGVKELKKGMNENAEDDDELKRERMKDQLRKEIEEEQKKK
jgi:sec-independent protein translocase protein TatA